jgi:YegS/Rv2252/BmrU family lipid kinase
MSAKRFVFIVNPRSAAGATLRRFEAHRRQFTERLGAKGIDLEVRLTERPQHATTLARDAVKGGAVAVVAVGGDGTNNEVVNGFFDDDGARIASDTALGVVTSGTGGDFRRTFGWSTSPAADLERLVGLKRRRIDVGRITCVSSQGQEVSRYFINVSSCGLSGVVVDIANRSSKRLGAKLSFMAASVEAIVTYTPKRVRISIDDGAPFEDDVAFVAVANGQYFGGGMRIAPDAVPDDGLFDSVVVVGGKGFMARHGLKLYSGTHTSVEGVRVTRCKTLRAEAVGDAPVHIDLDGEQPGVLPARWEIVPAAIDLLV